VPGAAVPFTVQVPEAGLNILPGDLAVLAVEIEATGEEEQDAGAAGGPAAPLDPVLARTVLTATRTHAVARPLDVSWVVPLTLPADPDLTGRDATQRHEAWLAATGPASPARTWLESLTVPGVTWMVDPAMLVPPDPADELVPAPPGEDDPDPADEQPQEAPADEPQDPGPTDDESTAPAGAADEAQKTSTPGEHGGEVPAGADGGAVTGVPPDPAPDGGSGAAATQEPGNDPEDEGPGGEVPGGEDPGPATAADVEQGLVTLRGLLARAASKELWWTPVADPDVAALLALESSSTTVRSAMTFRLPETPAQAQRLLRRGRSDVAWPALTAPTAEDVAALDRFWAARPATPGGTAAVIVPRESLSGRSDAPVGGAARRVLGEEGVVALGADTRVAALLADADTDSERVGEAAVVQRLLADSLTAYQQDPLASRSMLYAPPRGARVPGDVLETLSKGFRDAPWARTLSAADLFDEARATEPVALSGTAPSAEVLGTLVQRVEPATSPLDARTVRRLTQLDAALVGLSQVLGDDTQVPTWKPLLAHLWSTRWRGDAAAWTQTWQGVRRPVLQVQEAIHVNPSTVNFLSDEGIMQVTVVNDLPVPVEGVRVQVRPDSTLLRIVQQPEPISIGAGSRATVSFTAQAVTRGVTAVSARLTTPNGTMLGDDAVVRVRVQPTGVWIYWVLGTVAGLVLVLGLVRALRSEPRAAVVAASTAPQEDR
jgi:hypothetical protein